MYVTVLIHKTTFQCMPGLNYCLLMRLIVLIKHLRLTLNDSFTTKHHKYDIKKIIKCIYVLYKHRDE